MITFEMIAGRVSEIISEQYPSCDFYTHTVPASIARPSFNIYLEADRSEDGSLTSTNETASVGIVYYAPSDEPVPDELKPLAVYSNIKEIFRRGCIRVGDRSLKIVLLRGGRKDNEIFLIVKLVYAEERPGDEIDYDLMGDVSLKTKKY